MKKTQLVLALSLTVGLVSVGDAQQQKQNQKKARPAARTQAKPAARQMVPARQAAPVRQAAPARTAVVPTNSAQRQLADALNMVRNGQYANAAPVLYSLSRRTDMEAERMQVKYILGVALSEMKMYQTAAFQFVDVIRNGNNRYIRQAIERLSIAADALGDDTLLNYAVSKVQLDQFPANQKDVIYFRLGEIKLRNGQAGEAADLFNRVSPTNRYSSNAKFNRGLALLEANKAPEALAIFNGILRSRQGTKITDPTKVASQLAIARTYYQMQDWDQAIAWYRQIPRDSEYWHDALFESSWAVLRGAKFRSTLSNLQSLHSAFYEDRYIPESLLVRSIVYLFICKFDETDKTLNLFDKTYSNVRNSIQNFLANNRDPSTFFSELEKAYYIRKDRKTASDMRIPYMVARSVLDEGNIKRAFNYLKALNEEKARIEAQPNLMRSPLGVYAMKVLATRFKNAKLSAGDLARVHMTNMLTNLNDFFEQASFIRYEMINGKKELLKKRIAGKGIQKEVDEDVNREFYIQNGYEYWPFDGEYWLDEIGNYHYLGQQSCE